MTLQVSYALSQHSQLDGIQHPLSTLFCNCSIRDQLESLIHLLKSGSTKHSIKAAKATAVSSDNRNKIIKTTEKSSAGWKTGKEQISDSLASKSEYKQKLG